MSLGAHITALPFIIKPWHKATVRWKGGEYHATFEGQRYNKHICSSRSISVVREALVQLGFTQYKIRGKHRAHFELKEIKQSSCTDEDFDWESLYSAKMRKRQ